MKGVVLGFDEASGEGVISGEDGQRYRFVRSEWQSPTPPRAQDKVDFVGQNGQATGVFAAAKAGVDLGAMGSAIGGAFNKGALSGGAAPGQGAAAEFSANPVNYILARPQLIIALVMLLGCLFAFVDFGREEPSIVGMFGFLGEFSDGMEDFEDLADTMDLDVNTFLISLGGWVWLALYAIPVVAGVLIWREVQAAPNTKPLQIIAGVLAIGLAVAVPFLSSTFIQMGLAELLEDMPRSRRNDIGEFDFEAGFWIVVLSGAAMLANAFGLIKLPSGQAQG